MSDPKRQEILDSVKAWAAVAHAPKAFEPGKDPVPVSGRVFDPEDVAMLVDSGLDFWLTTGRFNDQFERTLGDYLGAKAMTVNSGSSANLMAFAALTSPSLGERALKAGDEVLTVAAGFPTTVNPSLIYGLSPVFVDVDAETSNALPAQLEAAVSPKTKAIMMAHTLGNPFDLEAVTRLAKEKNLWLIEDCCDALGSLYGGKKVGTFGDLATFSFYPAHHITMGEGGAVVTKNARLRKLAESFRDWGRDCWCAPGKDDTCGKRFEWKLGDLPEGYDHKYIYSELGYNLKITDMQAAVGCAQWKHLGAFITARRKNWDALRASLADLEKYFIFQKPTAGSEPSWFGFLMTLKDDAPFDRRSLIAHLSAAKIGTRQLFAGDLTAQPYMKGKNFRVQGELKNTRRLAVGGLWIGIYPGLTERHLQYVSEVFHQFCGKY